LNQTEEVSELLERTLQPSHMRLIALCRTERTEVEIAAMLGISPSTVRYHKSVIRARLGGLSWREVLRLHRGAGFTGES
jgi:DNA-binding CsgD family transcriptional regulator